MNARENLLTLTMIMFCFQPSEKHTGCKWEIPVVPAGGTMVPTMTSDLRLRSEIGLCSCSPQWHKVSDFVCVLFLCRCQLTSCATAAVVTLPVYGLDSVVINLFHGSDECTCQVIMGTNHGLTINCLETRLYNINVIAKQTRWYIQTYNTSWTYSLMDVSLLPQGVKH